MEKKHIFVTAFNDDDYNCWSENEWEAYVPYISAFCKSYVGTEYIVLTDFPYTLHKDCFCGLPVEVIDSDMYVHSIDHYSYYKSIWRERPVREVYAIGEIYGTFARLSLQALVDLCCMYSIPCQIRMYL